MWGFSDEKIIYQTKNQVLHLSGGVLYNKEVIKLFFRKKCLGMIFMKIDFIWEYFGIM